MNPYRVRDIRLLEVWEPQNWRMKVYGIACDSGVPSLALIQAGKDAALGLLSESAVHTQHYGLGFLGVHEGAGACVVFVAWWARENELHYHAFIAKPGQPDSLRPRGPDELLACVWDLEVVAFERDAWVRCILEHVAAPRWEEYLSLALHRSPPR